MTSKFHKPLKRDFWNICAHAFGLYTILKRYLVVFGYINTPKNIIEIH